MKCNKCGCENPENAKFCRDCGIYIEDKKYNDRNSLEKRRKKNLYGLLISVFAILLRFFPIYGYGNLIQNITYSELYIAIIFVVISIILFSFYKVKRNISLFVIFIAILYWGFVMIYSSNVFFEYVPIGYSQNTEVQNEDIWVDPKDGKTYKTLNIDGLVWMAENYEYKPNEGRYVELRKDQYSNVGRCGLLYNWETAKKVCPTGWRLPTPKELIAFFQQYGEVSYDGEGKYNYIFGEYNPDLTQETFNKIMAAKGINIPNCNFPNNYDGDVLRSLLWTSERDEEDYDRAYAVYWRCDNPGIYFSSYPVEWFGFCRFVKEKP